MAISTFDIPLGLERQAETIYARGEEAVVFAFLTLANMLGDVRSPPSQQHDLSKRYTIASQFSCASAIVSPGHTVIEGGVLSASCVMAAKVRRLGELFPVLEVGRPVIEAFASLKVELERQENPLDDFDLLIASTALVMGYCLVTNSDRHLRRVPGLEIENWTEAIDKG